MPNDDYLNGVYQTYGAEKRFGTFESFKTAMETNDVYRKGIYDNLGGESVLGQYTNYEELTKKKDGTNAEQPDGSPAPIDISAPSVSTETGPQAATSMWGLDGSGKPDWLKKTNTPASYLNTRQRSDFVKENGYVLSPDKQNELASRITNKPLTQAEKEKDNLIDFIAENSPEIANHERGRQIDNLKREGKLDLGTGLPIETGFPVDQELSTRTTEALKKKGVPVVEDAITFVNDAIKNKDYGSLRKVVNSMYGYQDEKLKNQYNYTGIDNENKTAAKYPFVSSLYTGLKILSLGAWDGVSDQYDREIAPARQEKERLNTMIDALSAQDYSIINPKVKDNYENDFSAAGKPVKQTFQTDGSPLPGTVSPNQYTGLQYFKENNPEMYQQMVLELGKSANPELFGKKTYDTKNRDYQYMMYQLDKKGMELNGMAINQRADVLAAQKKDVDVEYRSQLSNIASALKGTTDYAQREALQQQLNEKQAEYSTNPVIQEFNKLTAEAQSLDTNIADKYPDYASVARERMVKDILQNDLKGENIFIKTLNEFGERMKWMVANTSDALGNVTGVSEAAIGSSRNYFRDLRRGELQQDEMYQPGASTAMEPLYKLNFNSDDYEAIKAIKYSDMKDKEKTKAIADYLDANQERIRYVENPSAGKQNWAFGAIGNQLGDVGSQIIYQAALTYLTAGAGRAALGINVAGEGALAAEAGNAATAGVVADAGVAGLDRGAAAIGENIVDGFSTGLDKTSMAIRHKIVELGSIMGATYATAYQPAYFQAIQDGKSTKEAGEYANQIAIVNALTETISPDIEIVKRSLHGAGGLTSIVSESALRSAKGFGQATRAFAKGYLKNTVGETAEEVLAAYGEYGVDALHNINQDDQNSIQQRVQQAAWGTIIGMAPFGIHSGFSTIKANNNFQREAFYQAGVHPDIMRGEISQLIHDGGITQEEGNRRIQMVNTMENIVKDIPDMDDGTPMTSDEKTHFAWNEAQAIAFKNQAADLPDGRKKTQLLAKQDEYLIANDNILKGNMRIKAAINTGKNGQTSTDTPAVDEVGGNTQNEQNKTGATVSQNEEAGQSVEQKQAIVPTVAYAPDSSFEAEDIGKVKVISEKEGIYTLEMPDGSHEDFTGKEINEQLRPVQETPVREDAPKIAEQQTKAAAETAQPAASSAVVAPATQAEPVSERDKANQTVISGLGVDDFINSSPYITEFGKESARKDETKSVKEVQQRAKTAFDYLDGKINARQFIEAEGYVSADISDKDAIKHANRDSKYFESLRQQEIDNQRKNNEQQSAQEQTQAAPAANSIQETPPTADQSPSANEAIISPVNQQTNGTEKIFTNIEESATPSEGGSVRRASVQEHNIGRSGPVDTGIRGNETSSGQERGANASIRAANESVETSNKTNGNGNAEVGGNRNQASTESERSGLVTDDTGGPEGVRGGNQEAIRGVTEEHQKDIAKLSIEDLYNGILEADPNSEVKDKAGEYSKAELQAIYTDVVAANKPAEQSRASQPASEVSTAVTKMNDANNLLSKRKADLDAVKNKNTAEYQGKKKLHESAQQKVKEAEKGYLKALSEENTRLRRQTAGRLSSGISITAEDARIIANYVRMLKIYLKQGVRSLQEFANKIGEPIDDQMTRAWNAVTATEAPLKETGESYKDYLKRLREWQNARVEEGQAKGDKEMSRDANVQAAELRLGVKKMQQGVALLKNNPSMGLTQFNEALGLDAKDYETYVAALKWNIDNTPSLKVTSQTVLDNLRQSNPKMVTRTEMSLLRNQMAAMERGSKLGYNQAKLEIKNIQNQINYLIRNLYDSGLLKSGKFNQNDLAGLARQVNNARNEEGIQNLSNFIGRLIDNSTLAQTLSHVNSLQDKLANMIKAGDVLTANRLKKSHVLGTSVLNALKSLNPLQVTELTQFHSMLDNIVNSLDGKEVLKVSDDDVINFVDAQNQEQLITRSSDLKERYAKTLAIADENNTAQRVNEAIDQGEFNSMVDTIMNNRELSRQGKLNELKALNNAVLAFEKEVDGGKSNYVNLAEVYDEIKAVGNKSSTSKIKARLMPMVSVAKEFLNMALDATDFQATEAQKGWVNSMLNLNVNSMSNKELSLYKNTIDNILVNNDFSGVEGYDAKYKGQQRVQRIVDFFTNTGKAVTRQAFTSKSGAVREAISSTDLVVTTVANNDREVAIKLMDATGLGDIKAYHAQAKQVLEKQLIKPLKEIYKKFKSENLRTFESNFKRSIYAYLSQNNYGNTDDVQREFDRRKGIIMQDIAIKSASDEQADLDEAAALKDVFDTHFAKINTQDELQAANILSPGERAVYDLIRNFYDEHKNNFKQVTESLLNLPFNDVKNYVKDSYKTLKTNITEGDLTNIASSGFTPQTNINVASNANLQRNSFNNLNNIDVTDQDGRTIGKRVINHDFDNVQIYNATSMIEDIHTLKTRMEAMEALEDPRFKEAIGVQNMKVLSRNVENQVKSQMNMRKRGLNAGTAEVVAQDVANAITKIGARNVLFSGDQVFKQPGDIIINTVWNMGMDAGLFFKSLVDYPLWGGKHRGDIQRLLHQSEIGLRGHTFGGTAWLGAHALSEIKNTLNRVGKNAELKDADVLSGLIEKPDTWTAKVAWLSYYAQSLKRQGIIGKFSEVNWKDQADNINREARDYAQLMTSGRLNVNSKSSQSDFFSRSSGGGSLLRSILLPFSSFNMNNNALLAADIATLTTNAMSKEGYNDPNIREQKLTALRSIGSRMAAEIGFQAIRGALTSYVIKPAAYGILSLLGVDAKEPENKDFWHRVLSESATNMFFGLLGNFSSDFISKGINWAVGDDQFIYRFKDNPNSNSNNYPGADILINPNKDNYQYIKNVFSEYTNKKGKDVTTTANEKALLMMTAMYNVASNFGYAEGDTKRILNKAAQVVVRDKAKERGDPFWMMMNDPNSKPQIRINHKDVNWTPEQLEYYNTQRQYHMKQMEHTKFTDEYKGRQATERAKVDLQRQFKGQLNLTKPPKK